MLMAYASIAAFFLVAAGFMIGSLLVGKLIRPTTPTPKSSKPTSAARHRSASLVQFQPAFYIVALIYIVFDVEIAFIYPIAAVFKRWVEQGRGVFALLEVLVFVVILLLGLVYVWVKGDLEWIRSIKGESRGIPNVVSKTAPALPAADGHARGGRQRAPRHPGGMRRWQPT